VSTFQWLLALHVTGAFFFLGSTVIAGTFGVLAQRRERPSEIALFLGLARASVVFVISGAVLTLVPGLWLVHQQGRSYGQAWIVASIALLVASSQTGKMGGDREAKTLELARKLAAGGDTPSAELHAQLRDPVSLALSWGATAGMVVILALMVWKPGA
jgi:uncharacterized membrane protein